MALTVGQLSGFGKRRDFNQQQGGGGGDMSEVAAARYFRLTITRWSVAGSPTYYLEFTRVAEFELLVDSTPYPSANMSANSSPSPLVATASSNLGAGFEEWRAFDGDLSDSGRWISNSSALPSPWIQIDLGSGNEILPTSYNIAPDGAAGSSYFPLDWRVEASNTGNWTGEQYEVDQQSNVSAGWTNNTLRNFSANAVGVGGEHRYWRLTELDIGSSGQLEISELQLLSNSVNVTSNATPSSSSAPDNGTLSQLVDGDTGTAPRWSALITERGQEFWIAFDFGANANVAINGVKQAGYDIADRHMAAFTLQYSDDSSTWTT